MKTTPRLFVDQSLATGAEIELGREQAHYLAHVLRLAGGDPVRAFNGNDGEWLCYLGNVAKKAVTLRCEARVGDVKPPPDIDYVFAPLKHARLDYVVQKATELGARRLRPVITARTIVERVNLERMRANVIEAAEQCNLVYVPEVLEPRKFETLLSGWDRARALVWCDETAKIANPLAALKGLAPPAAVLVGPEGGFTREEKGQLIGLDFVTAISLGPRIMRADTAGIAALTLMQAVAGDWV
ncbi:MAG: 16S rRNA (uracil(1498)-N(3))-methyltransferase [Rhizobiales bacterium]|nr:16S rRNA (uracil(1498)-N(3))-methyltransferase [Hyphomicrobiales bacterium]MBI3672146.1 16S rRNA (uracil(1498)-N(3))-methyltransferase [Hyphomicrobiales bacterium]